MITRFINPFLFFGVFTPIHSISYLPNFKSDLYCYGI
jgi:hypothetical protein